jgi:hypothetical protein
LETWDKLKDQIPKIPGRASDGSLNYQVHEGKRKYIQLFGNKGIRFEMVTLFIPDNVRGRGWDICLITEAAFMDKVTFRKVVLKRVNRSDYYGAIMLISTPKNNWFDEACEDARDKKGGEFSSYQYFHATSFDNPKLDQRVLDKIRAQERGNPAEFEQERMAKLFVTVVESGADRPFEPGVVACCLTKEPIKLSMRHHETLLVFDLIYGGEDKLCLGVWNAGNFGLARLHFWTSAELKIDVTNPAGSLVPLIEREAAKYPGCKVAFDIQGQYGGSLASLLPARLRIIPMKRTRDQKNDHVENCFTRMATVDQNGISLGIRLPDPNSSHLEPQQRVFVKMLLEQVYRYRKIYVKDKEGNQKRKADGTLEYYYTKGEGVGDDGMDMVSWACSQLPGMEQRKALDMAAIRRRVLG